MRTVDERVVDMQFNNKQFESGIQTSLKSLDSLKYGLDDASKNDALSAIQSAVETISSRFSALGIMGVTALRNITISAGKAGIALVKSLTLDPITSGLQEYETQMNSVQTILANTQSTQKKVSQESIDAINNTAIEATKSMKQSNESALENLKDSQRQQLKEQDKTSKAALKVLTNQYELESEMLEKAINEENNSLKALYQEKLAIYDEELRVLEKRYEEESEAMERAIAKENESLKDAHQEKLSLYEEEFMAKLKIIDEERHNKIKAIDDQIASISNLTKSENEAREIAEQNQKLQELQNDVLNAKNAEERIKNEKKLAEYQENITRKRLLKERENQIASLKATKDDIKETYKLAEEQLKSDYAEKKNKRTNSMP